MEEQVAGPEILLKPLTTLQLTRSLPTASLGAGAPLQGIWEPLRASLGFPLPMEQFKRIGLGFCLLQELHLRVSWQLLSHLFLLSCPWDCETFGDHISLHALLPDTFHGLH